MVSIFCSALYYFFARPALQFIQNSKWNDSNIETLVPEKGKKGVNEHYMHFQKISLVVLILISFQKILQAFLGNTGHRMRRRFVNIVTMTSKKNYYGECLTSTSNHHIYSHMHVHTYIHTYVRTYIVFTCMQPVPSYLLMYIHSSRSRQKNWSFFHLE